MVNLGIIGAGDWGKNHVRVCSKLDGCRLVKLAELNKDYLEKFNREFSVAVTSDYKEILNDKYIDAVDICTPASTHYSIVKEALEAGKHVFVEKPITLRPEEGEDLIRIAKREKKVLMVGHIFRFHPAILKLKEEIKRGTFGNIRLINSNRVGLMLPKPDCGVIFDYALHDIDISCFLLDDYPSEVSAVATGYFNRDFEDVGSINLKFKSGALSTALVSWLFPEKLRCLWIIGDKKSASLDYITQETYVYGGVIETKNGKFYIQENSKKKLCVEPKEPLKEEINHFIECIKNGRDPRANGEAGVNIVKVIEALHESIKEKRVIKFNL